MGIPIKSKFSLFLVFLSALSSLFANQPVELRYRHKEGQVLHADSYVTENVYINGYLSHKASIGEFSLSSVESVDEEGAAWLNSRFRTVERIGLFPGYYEWISSESVRLERKASGLMTVPPEAARPVLRDVPSFPDHPVAPGEKWTIPGEEVHVLRINGALFGPYRSTTPVVYHYRENRDIGGREVAIIDMEYTLYLPVRSGAEPVRLISGLSKQQLTWDIEKGLPLVKTEDFEFMMMMANGSTQEFIGRTITEYRESENLNRDETAHSLRENLGEDSGITVNPTEEGVLLSLAELDAILFEPESAELRGEEASRLDRLSGLLEAFNGRDILITGHTADYGTAEGRKKLSFERASAVADLLFPRGRAGEGKLFIKGAGSSEPVGTDRENRRVEILILD